MWSAVLNRLSLRSVLIVNVIVPLLFAMALATWFGFRTVEHVVESRLQEDVELVARAIRLPVSYSLEKKRFGSVGQALQSVFSIGRVYGAYVYDKEGRRIAAVGAVEPEQQQQGLQDVLEGGKRRGQYEKIEGRRVYSYFVPLFDSSGKTNGMLQITRKKSDIQENIHTLRLRVIAILVAAGLFMSGLVLFGFYRAAGRYFTELAQSMTRVRSGERSHRAPHHGPREIASLARVLNNMLDSVDRSEKEVEERRRSEQELENRLWQSEKMAAIGQLAGGVAHELGSPLSLIDGKAQRALRDPDISATHEKSLRDIRGQVGRMNDLVRQLLDFGKGAMREKRWVRADRLAGSAVLTIQKETGASVEFVTRGPEPGPFVYADPLRFEQALINLLRNAAQTGKATRVAICWELAATREVIFKVEDNGPGIADEVKPRIFEPFFSTGKNGRNTGLGLSVVHGIVREHSGSIRVFDAELGGAGFEIVLPPQEEKPKQESGAENV
ncbi:MAG: HAMP domain-containing protein [Desulfobacterales bacterium]|nr:HAMP domain-containing protein [Desulfobacterales bacterium]MBS3754391.1 HAMP domain-containing protein [Desulfobacterales bacterium]